VIELNIAFVVQLFNFLLLLIILNIFLYKPLRKVLAERRQVIELAKEKTASVDQEVQEKMRLYESRLREVKADAMARRAEAIKQAQLEETTLIEHAHTVATEKLQAIRQRIASETVAAKDILAAQAEKLSLNICEKILGRGL